MIDTLRDAAFNEVQFNREKRRKEELRRRINDLLQENTSKGQRQAKKRKTKAKIAKESRKKNRR